jgi:hypothetical protein
MRKWAQLTAALAAALLAAGCSRGTFNTRGTVLKDGQPIKVTEDQALRILLVPMPEDGSQPKDYYVAEFQASDSTFRVRGKDGKGMPPGKYRVALELLENRKDLLKGAFGPDNSPHVVTIQSGSDEITVDVGKAAGAPKDGGRRG